MDDFDKFIEKVNSGELTQQDIVNHNAEMKNAYDRFFFEVHKEHPEMTEEGIHRSFVGYKLSYLELMVSKIVTVLSGLNEVFKENDGETPKLLDKDW